MAKEDNSSTYLMITSMSSNLLTLKEVLGVIRRKCGQTLGLGLVDRDRTVVYY